MTLAAEQKTPTFLSALIEKVFTPAEKPIVADHEAEEYLDAVKSAREKLEAQLSVQHFNRSTYGDL